MDERYHALKKQETRIFINPPHTALFFLPVLQLNYAAAYETWQWASALFYTALLLLLIHQTGGTILSGRTALILALLAFFPPWFHGLLNGQLNLLMMAGLMLFYQAMRHHNLRLLAAALFLFSFKPHLFVLLAIPLLFEFRLKGVLTALGVMVLVIFLSSLSGGIGIWSDYLSFLQRMSGIRRDFSIHADGMYNLSAILLNTTALSASATRLISLCLLGVALTGGALMYAHSRHAPLPVRLMLTGWLVTIGLFLSPWTHMYSLLALLVPAFWSARFLPVKWQPAVLPVYVLILALHLSEYAMFVDVMLYVVFLLMMIVAAMRYQRHLHRSG
jgi:hypothetical protein